jgi:hypothetical protein
VKLTASDTIRARHQPGGRFGSHCPGAGKPPKWQAGYETTPKPQNPKIGDLRFAEIYSFWPPVWKTHPFRSMGPMAGR